jgi:hypothetical protein
VNRLADVTSDLGHLYKVWLLADLGLNADNARRNLSAVANALQGARKMKGIQRWQLTWPTIKRSNDVRHRDVDPSNFVPLYRELKRRHRITHANIAEGSRIVSLGTDPRKAPPGSVAASYRVPANLARITKDWIDYTFLHPKTSMLDFGGKIFAFAPLNEKPPSGPSAIPIEDRSRFNAVRWFLPTLEDVAAAYFLVLLHTGWNPETVAGIDVSSPDKWCDYRLGVPEDGKDRIQTVAIYGFKGRTGKEQIAFSLTRPMFHPYQVISSMIRWTEPMREVIRHKIADLEAKTVISREDRKNIEGLQELLCSPWLYFTDITSGPCGLRITSFTNNGCRNSSLKRIAKAAFDHSISSLTTGTEYEKLGRLLTLRQSDIRDGFASFLYDNSLYNILLVKRALEHNTLRSTRHYLRQKRHVAQRFREFRHFQTIFFDEARRFKVIDPTIVFLRVRYGDITSAQRARLADYRTRTRMGMGCLEPFNPPPELGQNGPGACWLHRCTICHHGVVFEDSLEALAKRAAELRIIRGRSAIERFEASSFQQEWTAIEWIAINCFEGRADEFSAVAERHYSDLLADRAYLFDQMPGAM